MDTDAKMERMWEPGVMAEQTKCSDPGFVDGLSVFENFEGPGALELPNVADMQCEEWCEDKRDAFAARFSNWALRNHLSSNPTSELAFETFQFGFPAWKSRTRQRVASYAHWCGMRPPSLAVRFKDEDAFLNERRKPRKEPRKVKCNPRRPPTRKRTVPTLVPAVPATIPAFTVPDLPCPKKRKVEQNSGTFADMTMLV